MSKKDYQRFADLIGECAKKNDGQINDEFIIKMAQIFKDDNPRFNSELFYQAIEKSVRLHDSA